MNLPTTSVARLGLHRSTLHSSLAEISPHAFWDFCNAIPSKSDICALMNVRSVIFLALRFRRAIILRSIDRRHPFRAAISSGERLAPAFPPVQRDADISWHTARKIDDLIGDPIAARFQVIGPELEDLFWNAG